MITIIIHNKRTYLTYTGKTTQFLSFRNISYKMEFLTICRYVSKNMILNEMSYIEFAVFRCGLPRECCSNMRLAKSIRLKDGITAFPTLTNTRAGALPRQLKPWQWEGGWENRAKKSNDHGATSAQRTAHTYIQTPLQIQGRMFETETVCWFMQSTRTCKKKRSCQKHKKK